MTTSYFTFGQSHAHAHCGFTFDKDVVVKITAENPRAVMFSCFGNKWAMEYSERPNMAYFPTGIIRLDEYGNPIFT